MSTNDESRSSDRPTNGNSMVVKRGNPLEQQELDWGGVSLPQSQMASSASPTNYFHAVRRNWLLGLVLGVIVSVFFGIATYWLIPNSFTPFAYVKVAMRQDELVPRGAQRHTIRQEYEVYKSTQLGLLKSPFVLVAALRKKGIAELEIVKRENDPLGWLQDELRVGYINDSELLKVSLTDNNAQETADLINSIVDAYLDEVVRKEEDKRQAQGARLTELFNSKKRDVRSKQTSLIALAEKLKASGSKAVETQATVNIRLLYDLRGALLRKQSTLGDANSAMEAGRAMLERLDEVSVPEIELEKLVRMDPVCKKHSEIIATLRQAVAQQGQMVLPGVRNHSDRLTIQLEALEQEYEIRENELRELIKDSKRAELETTIAEAEIMSNILTKQEKTLAEKVAAQYETVKMIGTTSVDIEMMRSELQTLEEALGDISAENEKHKIESQAQPRIGRAQEAQPPKAVDSPKIVIALSIIVASFGFVFPMGLIVWWDVRKQRVNTSEDVAKGLGISVIGSVPTIPSRAIRRLGSSNSQDLYWNVRLTESIDGISAKLLRNATIDDKRIILITSAVAGECKTTLATQIAMSLARAGRRTVLVDFDLRHPAIDRSFQLPLDPGVSESLCGEANVRDIVCETGMNNLFVLTAGRSDHHSLQALANGKDKILFDELREDFEFVIIDGSPILPVADSRYISQHVDTVVLSVFRDFSRMPKVMAACEILETFGVNDLEAVVTSSTESGRGGDRSAASVASV